MYSTQNTATFQSNNLVENTLIVNNKTKPSNVDILYQQK